MTSTRRNPRMIKTGEDQDVHTAWRRYLASYRRAGTASKAKRRTRRRERHDARRALRSETDA